MVKICIKCERKFAALEEAFPSYALCRQCSLVHVPATITEEMSPLQLPPPALIRQDVYTIPVVIPRLVSQEVLDSMPEEPFKRQVTWATPIEQPRLSCGLCGAVVQDDGFCVLCHLKRQVTWATPIKQPLLSCVLCGAVVRGDGFCVLCHLKQRRVVLEGLLEDAKARWQEADVLVGRMERSLRENADAINRELPQ